MKELWNKIKAWWLGFDYNKDGKVTGQDVKDAVDDVVVAAFSFVDYVVDCAVVVLVVVAVGVGACCCCQCCRCCWRCW